MSWQNNGDYYSFKQDSITRHAPTGSGVYGLFNSRHQILIGSAANIRDSLLHHRRNTKFRFYRFEPSGFTFELCPPERREQRAEELIKELAPISSPQSPIGIATLYRSWRAPNARAFKTAAVPAIQPNNKKIVTIATNQPKAKHKAHLWVDAERFGLAGALSGLIFLAIGLIGLLPHLKNIFDVIVRNSTANAESNRHLEHGKIRLARAEKLSAGESADDPTVTGSPTAGDTSSSVIPANKTIVSLPTEPRSSAPAAAAAPTKSSNFETVARAQAAKRALPVNSWSVQVMATTDKQFADDWLRKLKAKGYEAYRVDAAVKGKIWHRVRVGTFETRQDADNLRAELKAKEGYRDAFVTS